MQIRKAEPRDIAATLEIYNYEVISGISTLDLHPKTEAAWREWFFAHNRDGEGHPLLVAELDGRILGYACLSGYREKEAYRSTVELSVYVAPGSRRLGVATALMESIISLAREDENTHMIVSVITAGNAASERLHEKFGFSYSGTLHEVGYKHGEYRDIRNYELFV